MFEVGGVVVGVIATGILGFAFYAWVEFRRNAKRTGELARHVRKYYGERDGKIEPREDCS